MCSKSTESAKPSVVSRIRCKEPPLLPFDHAVVGCVSIVAPVYIIYGVESELTGDARSNLRVVFEALFTSEPGNLP